ncbi:hypothetical protein RESH_06315 [Rhodopirellula europaea SH398]|uniref:Uncharacterized protein n=2 Tax=Rhodopirellula TaxID=265488 RepID=M5RUV4_9BACT|nr:hypothetical protein RESH_06315 [Rhodopirellula europaea SH398]PHQ32064.1 hypothetical protein CEE69_27685 [Rhodopirellula bahusiensis]
MWRHLFPIGVDVLWFMLRHGCDRLERLGTLSVPMVPGVRLFLVGLAELQAKPGRSKLTTIAHNANRCPSRLGSISDAVVEDRVAATSTI